MAPLKINLDLPTITISKLVFSPVHPTNKPCKWVYWCPFEQNRGMGVSMGLFWLEIEGGTRPVTKANTMRNAIGKLYIKVK